MCRRSRHQIPMSHKRLEKIMLTKYDCSVNNQFYMLRRPNGQRIHRDGKEIRSVTCGFAADWRL